VFEGFLPVERRVSLGEGWTPLVDAPGWDCAFKLDYTFPTGSFKDRGAATTLSRAAELGIERVLEDSSGNAGAAIATYAARAGIDARIYVPASAKASKLGAIERAGAEVERVEGSREAVTEACVSAVERAAHRATERTSSAERSSADRSSGQRGGDTASNETAKPSRGPREDGDEPRVAREGWYASHAWNPAFLAGTATMAYEIAAERDWSVPDAVVLPLGHGTMFLGAYRGFTALHEAGWTDEVPRLLGAQAAGYAPVADALHGPSTGTNDLADGIQIREPVRAEEIREAIEATGGDAIAVGREVTERELDRLHAAGFYTEPTCAVAPAALREYRDRGVLDADADVVVALSGSGLKT